MKTIDKNMDLDNILVDLPFEDIDFDDIDFDEEKIYNELASEESFEDLSDKGTCGECGDPNGYLSMDPYANMYGEGTNTYLCRHCSQNTLYS